MQYPKEFFCRQGPVFDPQAQHLHFFNLHLNCDGKRTKLKYGKRPESAHCLKSCSRNNEVVTFVVYPLVGEVTVDASLVVVVMVRWLPVLLWRIRVDIFQLCNPKYNHKGLLHLWRCLCFTDTNLLEIHTCVHTHLCMNTTYYTTHKPTSKVHSLTGESNFGPKLLKRSCDDV